MVFHLEIDQVLLLTFWLLELYLGWISFDFIFGGTKPEYFASNIILQLYIESIFFIFQFVLILPISWSILEFREDATLSQFSCVQLFVTPWTAARQASLSIANSLAQTHVHRVGDAIQPSHPLPSPSLPAFNLSQHQVIYFILKLFIGCSDYKSICSLKRSQKS